MIGCSVDCVTTRRFFGLPRPRPSTISPCQLFITPGGCGTRDDDIHVFRCFRRFGSLARFRSKYPFIMFLVTASAESCDAANSNRTSSSRSSTVSRPLLSGGLLCILLVLLLPFFSLPPLLPAVLFLSWHSVPLPLLVFVARSVSTLPRPSCPLCCSCSEQACPLSGKCLGVICVSGRHDDDCFDVCASVTVVLPRCKQRWFWTPLLASDI